MFHTRKYSELTEEEQEIIAKNRDAPKHPHSYGKKYAPTTKESEER